MSIQDPSLLITGATGQSAKWFFERLKEEKFDKEIKCLIRHTSKLDKLNIEGLSIKFITCDFNDVRCIENAMQGIKTVLHIAHITLTENIIEAGKKAGVNWFICVHTTGIYSKFRSAARDYQRIEDKILQNNTNITILRPTLIYGSKNDKNMWKLITTLNKLSIFPVFGNGKNLFQPVTAMDLGYSYYDVLINKSKTFGKQYNLSGRDQISYISILRLISSRLNKRIIFIKLPNWFCLFLIYILNKLSNKFIRCPIKTEQVLRMREDKIFSYKNASIDFNYAPIGFETGINKEIDDYIKEVKTNKK